MDIVEAIHALDEVQKTENLYFQGAFWIKGNSLKDILNGEFSLIIGSKILTDYYGDIKQSIAPKSSLTHKNLWASITDSTITGGKEWNYYPRGRVCIDQGTAYIHLNSKCNTAKILDKITKEYEVDDLRVVPDFNDEYQGSHYDFLLK